MDTPKSAQEEPWLRFSIVATRDESFQVGHGADLRLSRKGLEFGKCGTAHIGIFLKESVIENFGSPSRPAYQSRAMPTQIVRIILRPGASNLLG
jgi:hypothetical protein